MRTDYNLKQKPQTAIHPAGHPEPLPVLKSTARFVMYGAALVTVFQCPLHSALLGAWGAQWKPISLSPGADIPLGRLEDTCYKHGQWRGTKNMVGVRTNPSRRKNGAL